MVAEGDDGLLRQIRGGGREFRVDQRHIPVGAGEKRLVFERLAVLLQRFDQRLIGRFAPLLARDDGAQVLAQAGYPLRVQVRLRLGHGQEDSLVNVFRAPLRDGVKIAHGVQLVAEKLRAQRLFLRRRIHVQNAAAQRELSHALDQTCAGIARAGQAFDQLRHTVFRTDPKRHGRGKERLPRERAQQQRVQTCHQHRDASLRQRVQQPQPLLLPLPGHADGPGQRQLTRRQHGRLFA